ncbi:13189_t:CDS:2, partial [Cetraspora pellucida]
LLEEMIEILKPFEKITRHICSTKYFMMNLLYPYIQMLKNKYASIAKKSESRSIPKTLSALIPKKRNLFLSNMSSLISKKPKLHDTRAKKKDFDLSSEQKKTPIVEAETANTLYLPNRNQVKATTKAMKTEPVI